MTSRISRWGGNLVRRLASGVFSLLGVVLHRWPFPGGLLRVANLRVIRRIANLVPEQITITLRNGDRVPICPRDFDGRLLALFGSADLRVSEACMRLVEPGDVFLDIGANHGSVGLLVSNQLGEDGHVHLFEPQEELCVRLREAIHQERGETVTLHPIGLLDRDGQLDFWEVEGHSGSASFVAPDAENCQVQSCLPIRNVATYVPPLVQGRTWAAKIDIEGTEDRILAQLLQIPGLRFVVMECSHLRDVGAIWNLARRHSLGIHGFSRSRVRLDFEVVNSPEDIRRYEDIVLIESCLSGRR